MSTSHPDTLNQRVFSIQTDELLERLRYLQTDLQVYHLPNQRASEGYEMVISDERLKLVSLIIARLAHLRGAVEYERGSKEVSKSSQLELEARAYKSIMRNTLSFLEAEIEYLKKHYPLHPSDHRQNL